MIKISSSRSSKWPSLSGCHSVLFEAIREEQRQQPNRLSGDNGELSLVMNEENSKEVIASSASSEFKLRMVRFICEDGQVFIHGFLIASASGLLGQALIDTCVCTSCNKNELDLCDAASCPCDVIVVGVKVRIAAVLVSLMYFGQVQNVTLDEARSVAKLMKSLKIKTDIQIKPWEDNDLRKKPVSPKSLEKVAQEIVIERLTRHRTLRLVKERLALVEKERLALEEKERLALEEKERQALEEKERLALEEKERLALEEKERLALEEKEITSNEENSAKKMKMCSLRPIAHCHHCSENNPNPVTNKEISLNPKIIKPVHFSISTDETSNRFAPSAPPPRLIDRRKQSDPIDHTPFIKMPSPLRPPRLTEYKRQLDPILPINPPPLSLMPSPSPTPSPPRLTDYSRQSGLILPVNPPPLSLMPSQFPPPPRLIDYSRQSGPILPVNPPPLSLMPSPSTSPPPPLLNEREDSFKLARTMSPSPCPRRSYLLRTPPPPLNPHVNRSFSPPRTAPRLDGPYLLPTPSSRMAPPRLDGPFLLPMPIMPQSFSPRFPVPPPQPPTSPILVCPRSQTAELSVHQTNEVAH